MAGNLRSGSQKERAGFPAAALKMIETLENENASLVAKATAQSARIAELEKTVSTVADGHMAQAEVNKG